MLVYHGSYCIVDKLGVLFSRDALDFGKGFYVTNIEEQAIKWSMGLKLILELSRQDTKCPPRIPYLKEKIGKEIKYVNQKARERD